MMQTTVLCPFPS